MKTVICQTCKKELENTCGSVEYDLGFGCDCCSERVYFCSKECLIKYLDSEK